MQFSLESKEGILKGVRFCENIDVCSPEVSSYDDSCSTGFANRWSTHRSSVQYLLHSETEYRNRIEKSEFYMRLFMQFIIFTYASIVAMVCFVIAMFLLLISGINIAMFEFSAEVKTVGGFIRVLKYLAFQVTVLIVEYILVSAFYRHIYRISMTRYTQLVLSWREYRYIVYFSMVSLTQGVWMTTLMDSALVHT